MKKSQQIRQLETALKDSFNSCETIVISPSWQNDLLARLRQLKPADGEMAMELSRFEHTVWKLSWIGFTASAAFAVLCAIYVYFQNSRINQESSRDIYTTSIVMID
ncbi:MAG: hypothetical protein PHV59_07095 [Victivallales bacterium]|nr:hypothetical protein [Victivallales bacterium]